MNEIEKIRAYIAKRESGEFPLETRYQMRLNETLSLSRMDTIDAVCLAFEYGRAKGYRAAKAEAKRG